MGDDETEEACPNKIEDCSLVGPAGIEPATLGLEIRCSIRLSYGPVVDVGDRSIAKLGQQSVPGLSIA
jgi:hypothetical protein